MTDAVDVRHVALIMDGNGRWAKQRNRPRFWGHRYGAERFKEIMLGAPELGLDAISFYAFSKENWKRPRKEVDVIMSLWKDYVMTIVTDLVARDIRLTVIGDRTDLSDEIQEQIVRVEGETAHCTGTRAQVMVSYGSRWELTRAAQRLAAKAADGSINPEDITEDDFAAQLDTAGIPDPDLMIRTSGEQRISNYLLWQLSYAELMFVDTLWPDFSLEELGKCLDQFGDRERRFGGV